MTEEDLARLAAAARIREGDAGAWQAYLAAASRAGRERQALRELRLGLDAEACDPSLRDLYLRRRFELDAVLGDAGFPLATGEPLEGLPGPRDPPEPLALGPRGMRLARRCGERGVELRDGLDGALLGRAELEAEILALAFDHGGQLLGIHLDLGGDQEALEVWQLEPFRRLLRLGPLSGCVRAVAPDLRAVLVTPSIDLAPGQFLLGAPASHVHRHRGSLPTQPAADAPDLERVALESPRAQGRVAAAAFSPDGRLVAVASPAGLDLYQASSGALARAMRTAACYQEGRGRRAACRLAWSPDGSRVVAVQAGERLRIFSVETGHELASAPLPGSAIHGLFVAASRQVAVHAGDHLDGFDGEDARASGRRPLRSASRGDPTPAVASSPDGRLLLIRRRGALEIRPGLPPPRAGAALGHRAAIVDVVGGGDGRTVLARDAEGGVVAWDCRTGAARWRLEGDLDPLRARLTPHGLLAQSGSEVHLVGLETGRPCASLDLAEILSVDDVRAAVRGVALSPRGDRLLLTDSRGHLRLLDFPSGAPVADHRTGWDALGGCDFASEDLVLVSGVREPRGNPARATVDPGPEELELLRMPTGMVVAPLGASQGGPEQERPRIWRFGDDGALLLAGPGPPRLVGAGNGPVEPLSFQGPDPELEAHVRGMAVAPEANLLALYVEEPGGEDRWWFYRSDGARPHLIGALVVRGPASRYGAFAARGRRFVYSQGSHLAVHDMETLLLLADPC